MKKVLFLTTLFCAALTVQAQRPQMMRMAEPGLTDQTARKFTLDLTDDGKAQMVCFLPTKSSGKAIVGVPGGGYSVLSNTHEGTMAADWLNKKGIAYFVVNYRMPEGDRNIPIGDVSKGIRIVRDSAAVWGINPADVGIMGFSAGGHLASVISTLTEYDVRPNFTILFYPVISMEQGTTHQGSRDNLLGKNPKRKLVNEYCNEQHITKHTPRAFLALAHDDRAVPPVNSLNYYEELYANKVPAAMYIYPSGGHGFGIRQSFTYHFEMMLELKAWLRSF